MLDTITPYYIRQFAKWLSVNVNQYILMGEENQSICARIYEAEIDVLIKSIDFVCGKHHCRRAAAHHRMWEREQNGL